jgi:hypothetical protein
MKAHKHFRNRGVIKLLQDCLEGLHGVKQARDMLKAGTKVISPPPLLLQKLARLHATSKAGANLVSSASKLLQSPAGTSSDADGKTNGVLSKSSTPSSSKQDTISIDDSSSGTVTSCSEDDSESDSSDASVHKSKPNGLTKSPKPAVASGSVNKKRAGPGTTSTIGSRGGRGSREVKPDAAASEGDVLDRSKRRKGLSSMMGDKAARANDDDAVLSEGEADDGSTTLEVDGFDFDAVKADLYSILMSGVDVNDIVGFDPMNGVWVLLCCGSLP